MAIIGWRDIFKLQEAGFTVLRLDKSKTRILQATPGGKWVILADYPTQHEAKLDWWRFMNEKKMVEG